MEKKKEFKIEEVDLRYTELEDAKYLKEWLMNPLVRKGFPMTDEAEINDSVNRWISFYRYHCSLTALDQNKVPCGLSTLYLNPYRTLMHQCEFGIIVAEEYQGKGVGSLLMKNIIHLAKTKFRIELLHLQTKSNNPAIRLYEKFGFVKFGEQGKWGKELDGTYTGRIFMEKFI